MRTPGTAAELGRRRHLAVEHLRDGYSAQDVAEFLGVHIRTAFHWLALPEKRGGKGLKAKPPPGRPRKLTACQERTVLGWSRKNPPLLRLHHRTPDGPPGRPSHRTQVGGARRPPLLERLARRPRHHAPKTSAGSPRGRSGRHRNFADSRPAAPPKRARRQRATIVFLDERGLMLSPLVCRTLAPRGQTPKIFIRGRHREKVLVIAALTLSPKRRRLGLDFRTVPDGSFNGAAVAAGKKHAWRKELFDKLKGMQGKDGSWVNEDKNRAYMENKPELATAFAELSLSYTKAKK